MRSSDGDQESARLLWWCSVGAVTAATLFDSFRWLHVIHPDLLIAQDAGRYLLHPSGLLVYATHRRAQMGPAALLLALLPRPVYLVLLSVLLAPVLLRLADAGLTITDRWWTPRTAVLASLAAVCCIAPWTQLVWKGHADDALVLAGAALMLPSRTWTPRRYRLVGVAIAAAGKPTAVILLGLAAGWDLPLAVGAVVVFAVIWLPFVLADPRGFLCTGAGVMPVGPGSLLAALGYRAGVLPPWWVRAGQLGGGAVLAAVIVLRRRPAHALLAAFCLRALIDPDPAPAYVISLVVLATAVDAGGRLPWATALATYAFWVSQPVLNGGPGWYRLAALSALLILLLITGLAPPEPRPPVAGPTFAPAVDRMPLGRRP